MVTLVEEQAWVPAAASDFENNDYMSEIIEFLGSISQINNDIPIDMKINSEILSDYTIFSHNGKTIDNGDVKRLLKAGDTRGNKGVSSKGFAMKMLLGINNNVIDDSFGILNTSFFIAKIDETIKIGDETYTKNDGYIMFSYILSTVDGKTLLTLDHYKYNKFPEEIKEVLNNDLKKNIFIFVRKTYEINNEIKQKLRFVFSMSNWSLHYNNEELLQNERPGMFIDKKYNHPYLNLEFILYKDRNSYIGCLRIIDHKNLINKEIKNEYFIDIDCSLSNKTLTKMLGKKNAFSNFTSKDKKKNNFIKQYSCKMKLQNIRNNTHDENERKKYYGPQISEAGFVLGKNSTMFQTSVPSKKRNNQFREYLNGIRADGNYTRTMGFEDGQNLQCYIYDEVDYNEPGIVQVEGVGDDKEVITCATYKKKSIFEVQKIKADTDIVKKGKGPLPFVPFIVNAIFREFLWEKTHISEEPAPVKSPKKTVEQVEAEAKSAIENARIKAENDAQIKANAAIKKAENDAQIKANAAIKKAQKKAENDAQIKANAAIENARIKAEDKIAAEIARVNAAAATAMAIAAANTATSEAKIKAEEEARVNAEINANNEANARKAAENENKIIQHQLTAALEKNKDPVEPRCFTKPQKDEMFRELYPNTKFQCILCGENKYHDEFEGCHIRSWKDLGITDIRNGIPGCLNCNRSMGKKHMIVWLREKYPHREQLVINMLKSLGKDISEV